MSCCPNKKMPDAWSMTKDLSTTMLNAIRHAYRTGEVLTAEVMMKDRIEICNKCDRKVGVRCQECGCFVSLKVGVRVAKCPIGKW